MEHGTPGAETFFLFGAVHRIGERFVEHELAAARFCLQALYLAREALLVSGGLCEFFLDAAAVRLDAVDAAENLAALVSEDSIAFVRCLRRRGLHVVVVEALADSGRMASQAAE